MTVTNPANSVVIDGDNQTTTFGFSMQLPAGSTGGDLYYYLIDNNGVVWPLPSNYVLTLPAAVNGIINGGTVQYPAPGGGGIAPLPIGANAIPVGWKLAIYRIENLQQALSLATQGPFPSAGMMAALDYLTMLCQQLQEQINRSIKYPIGQVPSTTDVNAFIAAISAAIAPPPLIGTYAYCKGTATKTPLIPIFATVTDQSQNGPYQLFWYSGNPNVGDGGWFGPLAGG